MDRVRAQPRLRKIKPVALLATVMFVLVGAGIAVASIDFRTQRVDHNKITVDTVRRGPMDIKVSANGQLLPRHIELIVSQVSGRVVVAKVKAGDVVSAGQLIAELSNSQLIDSAEEAYAAWEGAATEMRASGSALQTNVLNQAAVVSQTQFSLKKAQLELEAQSKLIGQHIIPQIDYDRTRLNVAQLTQTLSIEQDRLQAIGANVKLELAAKQSRVTELARALDRAKTQAANLKVLAGISGIVQTIGIDVGQALQPGSPIGRIAQPDDLYAELKVAAREATDLQPGEKVLIDTHSGIVDGVVKRVDPAVTDGTVIVDADLAGKLPDGARPQLPVEAVIYLSQLSDTMYVGRPSYVKSFAALAVYKLDPAGRYATRVTIRSGKLSVNHLQVLNGLTPGDRIITSDISPWQDKDRILIN
jgi:multidrug resistance efflux pump